MTQPTQTIPRFPGRKYRASFLSMIFNYCAAAVKILFGAFFSPIIVVNGLSSLSVASSKTIFFAARKTSLSRKTEQAVFLAMCAVLAAAAIFYIAYMARLFFVSEAYNPAFLYFIEKYGTIFGVTVATVAFTELTLAILGIVRANKQKNLLGTGLKCVNLASAFTAIVFAQTALLAMNDLSADYSRVTALGGCFFGILCLGICTYMLIKFFTLKKDADDLPPDQP